MKTSYLSVMTGFPSFGGVQEMWEKGLGSSRVLHCTYRRKRDENKNEELANGKEEREKERCLYLTKLSGAPSDSTKKLTCYQ